MGTSYLTVGDASKDGQDLVFDFYLSEDNPKPGTPPKKILSHRSARVKFRDSRNAQTAFDILTLAIDSFEVSDK